MAAIQVAENWVDSQMYKKRNVKKLAEIEEVYLKQTNFYIYKAL
jgi:hypothetical protein